MLKIDSNIPEFTRKLSFYEKSELPFITARTLTETAKRSQSLTQTQIRSDFVIRKQSFPKSIKIIPAKKNDLVSEVYTMAPFASIHEFGGIKRPQKSQYLAIPGYDSRKDIKKRRRRRSNDKRKPFIVSKYNAVFRRKTKKRYPIEFLYSLKKKAKIPERLKMIEITQAVVNNRMPSIFGKFFEDITGRKL